LGIVGVKIEPPDMPFWVDDEEYDTFWKKLDKLGLKFYVDLGWDSPVNEYNFHIEHLENVINKFLDMTLLIQHLDVSYLWDKIKRLLNIRNIIM
jgi:predicted TIM-barrel fold metal-dependent hydrolase